MPAFALFVALLGSGTGTLLPQALWRGCGVGVLSGAGPSEPRGGASCPHHAAVFICGLPPPPPLQWVAAQSPENEVLSCPVAALLSSLMIWALVVGGPGASLSSAWLPIFFPWLVLGLLWVC